MKLAAAAIHPDTPPLPGMTRMMKAESGFELSFEQGLLSVRREGRLFLVPAAHVSFMEPAAKETK